MPDRLHRDMHHRQDRWNDPADGRHTSGKEFDRARDRVDGDRPEYRTRGPVHGERWQGSAPADRDMERGRGRNQGRPSFGLHSDRRHFLNQREQGPRQYVDGQRRAIERRQADFGRSFGPQPRRNFAASADRQIDLRQPSRARSRSRDRSTDRGRDRQMFSDGLDDDLGPAGTYIDSRELARQDFERVQRAKMIQPDSGRGETSRAKGLPGKGHRGHARFEPRWGHDKFDEVKGSPPRTDDPARLLAW